MTLLAGVNYDPGTAATKAVSAALAMTALDTVNLRLAFTAPANGAVLVRLRGPTTGATSEPSIFLGVLEGSTVRLRMAPMGPRKSTGTNAVGNITHETLAVVPGLSPGASLTWDAAYGVDNAVSGCNLRYGGPNNATVGDAWGGFVFEIYDTPSLLGAVLYDPATAVSKSTSAALAMTALDSVNLRITFTAPASGKVLVRQRALLTKADTTQAHILLGVLDNSSVVKGRQSPIGNWLDTSAVANREPHEASFLVTGLSSGTSYTFDAAYGVEIVGSGGTPMLAYGGPNNTVGNDAYGAYGYEIWAV